MANSSLTWLGVFGMLCPQSFGIPYFGRGIGSDALFVLMRTKCREVRQLPRTLVLPN